MKLTPNKAIAIACIQAELSYKQVAGKARIHPARFSAIKNGRINPSDDEQRRIARALGVTVDHLWPEVAA